MCVRSGHTHGTMCRVTSAGILGYLSARTVINNPNSPTPVDEYSLPCGPGGSTPQLHHTCYCTPTWHPAWWVFVCVPWGGAGAAARDLYGLSSCCPCGLKNNRLRGTVVFYVWSFCKSVLFIFELLHKFFIQKLLL